MFDRKKEYIKPAKGSTKSTSTPEKRKASSSSSSESEGEGKKAASHGEVKKVKPSSDTKADEKPAGNMIIVEGDSSLWRSEKAQAAVNLVEAAKTRDTEFEDYLEDLFF